MAAHGAVRPAGRQGGRGTPPADAHHALRGAYGRHLATAARAASCLPVSSAGNAPGGAEPWPRVHPGILRGVRAAAGGW